MRTSSTLTIAPVVLLGIVLALARVGSAPRPGGLQEPTGERPMRPGEAAVLFKTSDECLACHNGLRTPSGEDVSIGQNWQATMMANSSRDPYWQASVRRETMDHAGSAPAIEDECATCHMPMARTDARARGRAGQVFTHLTAGRGESAETALAHDGVSCTMCHQITAQHLGTPASFTGGYVITAPVAGAQAAPDRPIFGPFQIDNGLASVMHSSSEFKPTEAPHIRQSELCATCHTLITKALGVEGEVIGELPEQMMYLEWRHSAYATEQKSCQSCHMPTVDASTPIASVLGQPRDGMARHQFIGGNAFMLRLLNVFRDELGVVAPPAEMDASIKRTTDSLQKATALLTIDDATRETGRLNVDLSIRNLTGHKFPTGYPSRRAWLHVTVRDRDGRAIFESGALEASGLIQGNDADTSSSGVEPHYTEIQRADQVQIYESVMGDRHNAPTTGLLTAVRYLKDNRLLPRGFDQRTADPSIAVVGSAQDDVNFGEGRDRLRYAVDVGSAPGPFRVDAELRFQAVGYRWAKNLASYDAPEPKRFARYYDALASHSSELLAQATAVVP